MRLLLLACLLVAQLIAPSTVSLAAQPQELTVFAAASLTDAMKDIAAQRAQSGQQPLRLSFGASSALARQIEQGAPVNLFASADQRWMDYLAQRDLIAAGTRKDLLGNELVLVVPVDKPRHVTIGVGFDFLSLLGATGRIATGDPAHVPIGLYAQQALRKLGVWDAVAPRLARAEDVRSALLLVERGEAPAGIVYATDAAASKAVMVAGTFPASSHDPVTYPFAVTKAGDSAASRALLAYLSGPEARAIFLKRGFRVE